MPTPDLHASGYGPPPQGGGWGPPPGGFGPPGQPGPGGFGPPGQPGPGGFGGPGQPGWGGPSAYGVPGGHGPTFGQIDRELVNSCQTWLIVGIITAAFGCLPLGAIGAYLAHEAKQLAERGDAAGARSKLGTSKVLSGVAIGVVALGIILWLMLAIVGALAYA